jgi:hypothetical protein
VKVCLTQVGELNVNALNDFLEGKGRDFGEMSSDVIDVVNALNIVLRNQPSNKHVSVRGVSGAAFFPDPKFEPLALGGGLELWPGYHQSIRHSQVWKPLLNFDVANTAFYTEQNMIDFIKDTLRQSQLRPNLAKHELVKIEKAVKGLKIEPIHRQGVVRRYKVQ